MNNALTRRDFLKVGGLLAAAAGLSQSYVKVFAAGLEQMLKGLPRVLWLQGQSCSGCSVSLLNTDFPDAVSVVTNMISLIFHSTISAAQGHLVKELVEKTPTAGPFILAVEGSIPLKMPDACMIYGRTFEQILTPLLSQAAYIVAIGNCATYGGIPAAEGNETGAVGVKDFMRQRGMSYDRRLVNLPSCPTHPDAMVGTLAYLAGKGYPAVDANLLTPNMYYYHSTHDDCPRYHYYNKKIFAQKFGDEIGCLFKLGCLGMLTKTECPRRQWNGGVNWCIRAGAPCIGCSAESFSIQKAFPFYRKAEDVHAVPYTEKDRKGGAA